MKKVLFLFILLVFLIVGAISYVHYTTPYPVDTPSFPLTFKMTKLNLDGTELSASEVTITGSKLRYPSGTTCLDVDLTGLPMQKTLRSVENSDGIVGEITSYPYFEIQRIDCFLFPDGGFAHLLVSPDYERWAIGFSTNEPFYVGSVDNKYTTQELYEYFGDFCISPWPYDPANSLGRWVTPDGTLIENVEMRFYANYHYVGETLDGIALNFTLPDIFPYQFPENKLYQNDSEGNEAIPYYTGHGYSFRKHTGDQKLFHFALDKEKNWAIFVWEDNPEQYLINSNVRNFDSKEIIDHFKVFLDLLPHIE